MLNKLRRVGLRGRIGRSRGQGPMMEVILRVSLESKTNQNVRKYSPTKFLVISPRIRSIGFLNLILKGGKEVVHKVRNLVVQNVSRSMQVKF